MNHKRWIILPYMNVYFYIYIYIKKSKTKSETLNPGSLLDLNVWTKKQRWKYHDSKWLLIQTLDKRGEETTNNTVFYCNHRQVSHFLNHSKNRKQFVWVTAPVWAAWRGSPVGRSCSYPCSSFSQCHSAACIFRRPSLQPSPGTLDPPPWRPRSVPGTPGSLWSPRPRCRPAAWKWPCWNPPRIYRRKKKKKDVTEHGSALQQTVFCTLYSPHLKASYHTTYVNATTSETEVQKLI